MTDNTQPDALRLVEQYDYGDPVAHSNKWKAAACNELRRLYAENAALQQGYDAARLEIEHLRGVTKSKLLAQPVAWMVYLPSIDTQHLYYSQEDMGYVDDVTNHADAEVSPLYEMAAPKAEVAPAGEYPAVTTEFINKHAHPSQAAKLCREDWSGKDESSVETVQPEVIKLLHAYVDADRAMRAQADSQPAPVLGTIAHVGTGKTTLTRAIASALRAASTEADNVTAPAGGGQSHSLHTEKCPITGRPFFMTLDHPDLGRVPTYGGPYDSYTIPAPEGEPTDQWHERELRSERYDHDAGWWVEGGEPIPLRIVHEDVLFKLQEDAEAAVAPTPPAQAANSVLGDAARYRFIAGHCRSTSEHWGGRWSIIVDGPAPKSHDSEDDFDEAVDAARKQGANHE